MIGQYIQNYKIIAHLGQGGMGTVYRAMDTVLGREVALKMLHTQLTNQPQFLERFKKEARILAQLLHPNIAVIYNFIEQDNNHYMVMEYVEGENFDSLLRRNTVLSYNMVVPLFIQALEGLQHAHKKGIYHRDIKPSNLNLTPDGTVKLMDFGIAKIANEQRLTQVNRIVGTVEYMAPELIQGKDASVACDIYAIGVTMYEMLSGKLPFEGNTDYNLMQDILKKQPASIETMNASVPKALSNIVMKALEKKPEDRFPDARSFQQALMNAYPQLKEIDLNSFRQPAKNVRETQYVQLPAQAGNDLKPTMMMTNNAETSVDQQAGFRGLLQNMMSKQARPLLLTVVSLMAMAIITMIIFSKRPVKKVIAAGNNVSQQDNKPANANKDSLAQLPPQDNSHVSEADINTPVVPVKDIVEPIKEKAGEEKKKEPVVEQKKEKESHKKQPAVTTEITRKKEEKKKLETVPEKKEEKKNTEPAETKTHTPKRIEIRSRVSVEIRLQDRVMLENLSEGQTLHFIVTNSVEYEGETIIKRGAPVNVTIKGIGRVFIALTVNNIETAGGQKIYLTRVGLTKKKKDLPDGETYSINLGKGTTIEL
jgi:eukaryotic-like serine/threonine-protein kinase